MEIHFENKKIEKMNTLILLAGCGLGDGSCIEETVLTYLALDRYQCSYQAAAVDMPLTSVNHISEEDAEERNVLVESARIGRGTIHPLDCVQADDFDCLIIPGGIGLLRNYADIPAVRELIFSFLDRKKPIATMCAGIDFLRRFLGRDLLQEAYADLTPDSFCCEQSIYYTPAFRKTRSLCDVQKGIDAMIDALVSA